MKRFNKNRRLQIFTFHLLFCGIAYASPDPRLTSLIPPGVQLIAGISASSFRGQPANFVLMTGNNKLDLADFYALTGSDYTRHVHQSVFVAASDASGLLNEHSLLVSGNFNKDQLFKTAVQTGGTIKRYRGIEVAEIQPFERERQEFNEIRWLAVIDSSVLVFGSIGLIQRELDRSLNRSHADEALVRRLSRLRSKDQTWCVLAGSVRSLSFPQWGEEIRRALATVNPDLATKALSAEEFEFGLFYGKEVEFEYFLSNASMKPDKSAIEVSPLPVRSTALLPGLNPAPPEGTMRGIIAIPLARFNRWLAGISTSSH